MHDNPVAMAERARRFWLEHSLDKNDFVLLLPRADDTLAESILAAFVAGLAGRAADTGHDSPPRAIVLSVREVKAGPHHSVLPLSEQTANDILTLYCMYEFTDKLIVGSLDRPWGRKSRNLLDCRIAPRDVLIQALFS